MDSRESERQIREVLRAFPPTYERRPGKDVHPSLSGYVQVPPPWVWARTDFDPPYRFASLAKEHKDIYPEGPRETCVEFVKAWPEDRQLGMNLVLTGMSTRNERMLLGAGTINEIIMRFGSLSNLSAAWVTYSRVAGLVALKQNKGDVYYSYVRRIQIAPLLLICDPQAAQGDQAHIGFLQSIYEHRQNKRLTTITTTDTDLVRPGALRRARDVFGPYLADLILSGPYGDTLKADFGEVDA